MVSTVELGIVELRDNQFTVLAFVSTSVRILGSSTLVMCEAMNCENHAKFLFRTGGAGSPHIVRLTLPSRGRNLGSSCLIPPSARDALLGRVGAISDK